MDFSFAVNEGCSPILDLATLTGAMVVALGHTMTGVFSNDEQATQDLISAGKTAGEKYWPMPLDAEYAEYIHSDIADIKQTGGREAGSVTAAKILENFVGSAKWAHLDIAGTSYEGSAKTYQEKGGTGVGVRTLAEICNPPRPELIDQQSLWSKCLLLMESGIFPLCLSIRSAHLICIMENATMKLFSHISIRKI